MLTYWCQIIFDLYVFHYCSSDFTCKPIKPVPSLLRRIFVKNRTKNITNEMCARNRKKVENTVYLNVSGGIILGEFLSVAWTDLGAEFTRVTSHVSQTGYPSRCSLSYELRRAPHPTSPIVFDFRFDIVARYLRKTSSWTKWYWDPANMRETCPLRASAVSC